VDRPTLTRYVRQGGQWTDPHLPSTCVMVDGGQTRYGCQGDREQTHSPHVTGTCVRVDSGQNRCVHLGEQWTDPHLPGRCVREDSGQTRYMCISNGQTHTYQVSASGWMVDRPTLTRYVRRGYHRTGSC
jgi:hypothetical protein